MWEKAKKLNELGAGGFVHYVQQPEQRDKSRFVKHQTAAGTKRVAREDDPWTRGFSSTGAAGKDSTENQFGGAKKKDNALLTTQKPDTTGGIDLNPAMLNLQIMRDGNGVALPLPMQPVETMQNIEGFIPVIMQLTPVTTMPMILGVSLDLNSNEFGSAPQAAEETPQAKGETLGSDRLSYLK